MVCDPLQGKSHGLGMSLGMPGRFERCKTNARCVGCCISVSAICISEPCGRVACQSWQVTFVATNCLPEKLFTWHVCL